MKISDLVRIPILEIFIGFVIYYILMQFPEFIKFISSIIFIPEMTCITSPFVKTKSKINFIPTLMMLLVALPQAYNAYY